MYNVLDIDYSAIKLIISVVCTYIDYIEMWYNIILMVNYFLFLYHQHTYIYDMYSLPLMNFILWVSLCDVISHATVDIKNCI